MTNLDNIRQMNSEELAEHILGTKKCSCCKYRGDICRNYTAVSKLLGENNDCI